jgi:hypothetical protein
MSWGCVGVGGESIRTWEYQAVSAAISSHTGSAVPGLRAADAMMQFLGAESDP